MRQFTLIWIFLLMIVAHHSHANNLSKNSLDLNSVFFTTDIPVSPYVIVFQENLFDVQDLNDLDSFDSVFVLLNSISNFQQYKIENVISFFQWSQPDSVNEMLLDLPPPLLSV